MGEVGLAQGHTAGMRQGFLGSSPELIQFMVRSIMPTLKYLAAVEMPRSWLGGRKWSETCVPSKVQQIGEGSV